MNWSLIIVCVICLVIGVAHASSPEHDENHRKLIISEKMKPDHPRSGWGDNFSQINGMLIFLGVLLVAFGFVIK